MNSLPHASRASASGILRSLAPVVFLLTAASVHAQVNHRPTISWITNQRITTGSFTLQNFTVGDAETAAGSLTLTKASSNTAWLPTTSIVLGGSGANRTVSISPMPSGNGASTVTLTVSDGVKTSATSFTLQKATSSSNTPPVIQSVANEIIPTNSSYGSVPLVIKDDESLESALTLSAASSNTALVPVSGVVFGGQNWGRNVTVTPTAGASGRATITLTVSDGTNTTSTSFVLDVVSGSTPPTITLPVTFKAVNVGTTPPHTFAFNVADTETAVASLRVTATSSNTALVTNANLNVTGTTANRTLNITPVASATGSAQITLAISDGDIVRRKQLLYVVKDPAAASMQFARSNGVYILDSPNGSTYTPTINIPYTPPVNTRDGNLRSLAFVTGFVLRISWDQVEDQSVAGAYDFQIVTNLLNSLPAGQVLSTIISGNEPAYIAATPGVTTWNDGGVTRAVPWDPTLRTRRIALIQALAAHQVGGVALAVHPKLVLLDPFLPGGHTGLRNPTTLNLSAMPGYTRQKLLDTARAELELLQDHFPGKTVQIGFWPINDSENANYGGKAAWDWIRDQLFLVFDGLNRPLVGFFQENLAAKRVGAGVDPFTATPVISQGITMRNPGNTSYSETTWAGFQMLGNWTRPFNDNHVNNTLNGAPADAMEYAYNTYRSHYSEVYITDVDNAAMQPLLLSWHDYLLTRAAPAGLNALPTSSSAISVSWLTVPNATSYTLQRQTGAGAFSTVYTGATPSFNDTGLSAATDYGYRVNATTSAGATAWSTAFSALTFNTMTVNSVAAEDGYVQDNGSVFATTSGGNGLRAGEGVGSVRQVAFVSFDTSAIPDSATIRSITLRLKQGGLTGTPFTTLGTCSVDIKSGGFNGNIALEAADLSAAASASGVATISDVGIDNWATRTLSSAALPFVNKTGRTQLRMSFPASSAASHNVGWYPGESASNKPELIVEYQ